MKTIDQPKIHKYEESVLSQSNPNQLSKGMNLKICLIYDFAQVSVTVYTLELSLKRFEMYEQEREKSLKSCKRQ